MSEVDAFDLIGILETTLFDTRQMWVIDEYFQRRLTLTEDIEGFNNSVERRLWLFLDVITECLIHPVEFANKAQSNLQVASERVEIIILDEDGRRVERLWATKKAKQSAAKLRKLINLIRKEFDKEELRA